MIVARLAGVKHVRVDAVCGPWNSLSLCVNSCTPWQIAQRLQKTWCWPKWCNRARSSNKVNVTRGCLWLVAGVRVCRRATQHILGSGGGRLHRLRKGHMDRRIGPRGPGDPRSGNHFAFSRLYDHLWRGIVYIVITLCCSILPLRRVAL